MSKEFREGHKNLCSHFLQLRLMFHGVKVQENTRLSRGEGVNGVRSLKLLKKRSLKLLAVTNLRKIATDGGVSIVFIWEVLKE